MFPFLAAANVASGLISGITGLVQKHKANEIIKNNLFPEMAVPQAIQQNQRLAAMYANMGLPGQQYNQAMQNIMRNQNNAIKFSNDRRGGLSAIGAIQQNSNDAALNLDVADAAAKQQNQQRLMQQNNILGNWQNQVWDWNKRQQYLQKAAAARALLGTGNTNLNQGADRFLTGGLMAADYYTNNGKYSEDWSKAQGNVAGGSQVPDDYKTYLAIKKYLAEHPNQ